jgi:mRNA interferase RelE/StbE
MYELIYSDQARKQLLKLDKIIQQRIIASLERIRIRPTSHVKKLVGNPYFSLRVGNYRIILNIVEDKLIIFIIEMGHRKNIYQS